MNSFRGLIVFACLALAFSAPASHAELVLTARSGGADLPVLAIGPTTWSLGGAHPQHVAASLPGLHLGLQGRLADNVEQGVWAPVSFGLDRLRKDDRGKDPDVVAVAHVNFAYRVRADWPLGSGLVADTYWPQPDRGAALFVMAWVVKGRVRLIRVGPDYTGGALATSIYLPLKEDELGGQAVLLLWRDGRFVTPRTQFESASAMRASIACSVDDLAGLRTELKSGLAPDTADRNGSSLLQQAVRSNAIDCVRALLAAKAHLKADGGGRPPLLVAAGLGRDVIVRELLKAGARVDGGDKDGTTPLIVASAHGHLGAVQALLKAGADVDHADTDEDSAITSALDAGYARVVEALLRGGSSFSFRTDQNERAFVTQCKDGHTAVVELYLKHHVSANTEVNGTSALVAASAQGSVTLVGDLLKAGARVEGSSPSVLTPLIAASAAGNGPVVKLLLASGANVSARVKRTGYTALHFAAITGSRDVLEDLVAAKAPIDAIAKDGVAPLDIALLVQSRVAVDVLEAHGARLRLGWKASDVVVEAAIMMDRSKLVTQAIHEGWNVNAPFPDGWTPWQLARAMNAVGCARVLAQAKADERTQAPFDMVEPRHLDQRIRLLAAAPVSDPRDPMAQFPEQRVLVDAILTPTGRLALPRIRGQVDGRLARSVLTTLDQWRFNEPRERGRPVGVHVVLPIEFPSSMDRHFESRQVDQMPRVIKQEKPVIPFALQRVGQGGKVLIQFTVGVDGHTHDIHVVQTSLPAWGPVAVGAVERWTFVPGKIAGRPVPVQIMVPMTLSFQ